MRMPFLKPIVCILFCSVMLSTLQAQNKISGLVEAQDHKPIEAANILLLNFHDSVLVKGTVSKSTGNFNLDNINPGKYILHISATGFDDYYNTSVIITNEKDFDAGELLLKKVSTDLAAVTLVTRKPMFEQKVDRMIINVKASITSAGSTALEVLQKSPGVMVNRQNNSIALNGKSGVVVMINGKISRMPMDAVVQMLNGMNSANIERIELITTPPANFDAEGNAGFINIVLVENPNKGLNGSYTLSMGYGNGFSPSGATNFNYRNKKINLFGDYSFTWANPEQDWSFFNRIINQGVLTENSSLTERHTTNAEHIARLGIDFQVSPKTIIGAVAGGYTSKWNMTANNALSILKNHIQDTSVRIVNTELNQWKNGMGNINFSHTFKEGESVTADIDYLYYKDNNPNDYLNQYFSGTGSKLNAEYTRSTKITPFAIWVGKMDYTKKLNKNVNAEGGLKMAFSKFSNDVAVETLQQPNWIQDPDLTAKYKLKENIAAAYTAFSIAASAKINLKLGLRYEYTYSNLGSEKQQNIVNRKYGKFFPSIFMSQKIDDKNSINLSYSKRITRPTFKDMAPFVIFIDPYTFFSGNSALQPAFSNIYKADYIFKSFVFSASYTKEDEPIEAFQPKTYKGNKQIFAAENLDNIQTVNFTVSLPFTITTWWSMQNNLQVNWQQLTAEYSKGKFSLVQKNYAFNSSQNFVLPRNYSLELSGFYQSKSLFGAGVINALGMVNFGAQKKIGSSDKLRAGVDNIFNSAKIKGVTDIPSQNIYSSLNIVFMFRTYKLTYTHDFGNKKLKEKREHGSASNEEQGRIK